MRSVAENWQWEDLISLSREGLFDPDDLPPRDWGALLPLLGILGPETARLGGSAYAVAANASLGAKHLQYIVKKMDRIHGEPTSTENQKEMADCLNAIGPTQGMIREGAQSAIELFRDALNKAPKFVVREVHNLERLERSRLPRKGTEQP